MLRPCTNKIYNRIK